jgi:hypothetical protein
MDSSMPTWLWEATLFGWPALGNEIASGRGVSMFG